MVGRICKAWPMLIRELEERDRQAYTALYVATAAEGRWIGGEAPVDIDRLNEQIDRALNEPTVAALVATSEDDEVIGHMRLWESDGIVNFGMLLDANHRGQGIGQKLLEAGIAWARNAGAHKMALHVWPHNERAIALYRKLGFEHEGRLVKHFRRNNGELWDCLLMGLVLAE